MGLGGADGPAGFCADIGNGNTAYLDGPAQTVDVAGPSGGRCPPVGRFFMKLLRNRARSLWRELWRAGQWKLGIVDAPIGAVFYRGPLPPGGRVPQPPPGQFSPCP